MTHLDACGAVQVLAGSFPYLRRLINPVSDTQRCPEIKQQKINKINERTILDTRPAIALLISICWLLYRRLFAFIVAAD